jgi:hypothetical protein
MNYTRSHLSESTLDFAAGHDDTAVARHVAQGPIAIPVAASTALFAVTVLVASALMFVVEPMFARMILPRLGGSPAVWNTCLVFFQAALLGGYVYAHLLSKCTTIRWQVITHLALVVVAATLLPVGLVRDWVPPVDSSPIPWLLLALTVGVGGPFLILSATSPLLQHWFSRTNHPAARDPYHLYAASNVGSIVALLGYPSVIEPFLSLTSQSSAWTVAYGALAALVLACAVFAVRFATSMTVTHVETASSTSEAISWQQRMRWVALSIVPSSLLLSVTTYLSMDVAAVPLLWTIPLTLYLLSFVLAFARRRLLSPRFTLRALPLTLALLVLLMVALPRLVAIFLFPLHLIAFFLCALTLHTALAEGRPGPRRLTEFYLWIGLGGVLGGLFNTLVAPLVFTSTAEYPIGLVLACLIQAWTNKDTDRRITRTDILFPGVLGLTFLMATFSFHANAIPSSVFVAVMLALPFALLSASRRPIRFGLTVAAVLIAAQIMPVMANRTIYADRTFFGLLRVQQGSSPERHAFWHGSTVHGEQDLRPDRRAEPLSYYFHSGPIGQLFTSLGDRLKGAHIGVVGVGAGILTAYASNTQHWTLFEIDPGVVTIARNPELFTYLEACGHRCQVVLGDARLSLARERHSPFQLLVLDAFSSDAIPVHLMTREALALYVSKLSPDGVLVFNISNRFFDLEPLFATLASERNLVSYVQYDAGSTSGDGHYPSRWLVMARHDDALGRLPSDSRWQRARLSMRTQPWTDDYSNILSLLTIFQ